MHLTNFFLLASLFLISGKNSESLNNLNLIRLTENGLVRGFVQNSMVDPNIKFYSFKGVPYAQPPVGNLRFQEPLPAKKWLGIKETIAPAERCVQINGHFLGTGVIGSEDCLYLDVFEPITARKGKHEPLPVMVWFHGGTFIFGTSNMTGPDYFMEKPVVIVIAQYRLNVFGFLSTKDQHAKGNCGLKDQSFVLRWINKNIINFGGNPNKVTVFGESAGGASTQYHMLSTWSKGLFHRAISESGSTLDRWVLQREPEVMVYRLAKGLGIMAVDTEDLINKLQKVDYRTVMETAFNASIMGFYTPYYAQPFAPIIEADSPTAFMSESTFERLRKKQFAKIPYLMGYNTEEGSFGYLYINQGKVDIQIYEEDPTLIIPLSLNIPKGSYCESFALNQIKDFYFKNASFTDKTKWINYMSYELFVRGILKSLDFMYKDIPLYFYRISYTGSRSFSYLGGVGHAEELLYLFYPRRDDWSAVETESDKLTRKRLVTLWSNFATTANPTPEDDELLQNIRWPTTYPDKVYIDIGSNLTLSKMPEQEHFEFWENLFETCGYPPYVTY